MQKKLTEKLNITTKFEKVSLGISILALIFSVIFPYVSNLKADEANKTARESNAIAVEAKNVSKESLLFEKEKRSQDYAEQTFADLYQDKDRLAIVQKLRSQTFVSDSVGLLNVIDQLEGTGNAFCQGAVWKLHLNTILGNTLQDLCVNQQIYNQFKFKKNGFAMLCAEFYPESLFASSLKIDNIATCNFMDSSLLKNLR